MRRADALVTAAGARWTSLARHPFVATADGTLPEPAFDRWPLMSSSSRSSEVLSEVVELAPALAARAVLDGGPTALGPELELFATELTDRGLDPSAHQPSEACGEYVRWLRACPGQGWDAALAALHGVERAYLDAWTAVQQRSSGHRYTAFVPNWSSLGEPEPRITGVGGELACSHGERPQGRGQLGSVLRAHPGQDRLHSRTPVLDDGLHELLALGAELEDQVAPVGRGVPPSQQPGFHQPVARAGGVGRMHTQLVGDRTQVDLLPGGHQHQDP